ncbi:unknown structural protein [Synechococcus phage S-CBS2]|uniref:unknown structural protein n=1 Tax=Synechococcus phage S-CBS2 TaxID=753084 RepID=UPI00020783E6|nr:unknown structural protein [Synechococcus phage S-CBS2]ADF42369.1 unknown structural protein [Synechococcus phage S-CBS2]
MASPLLTYANSRVLVTAEGTVSNVNGRFVAAAGQKYLVKCFMKRAQYSGVSSGSKKIPLESQLDGAMLPGASGDSFYYRGYALEYALVASNFELGDSESALSWLQVAGQLAFLPAGREVEFGFGDEKPLYGKVERSSGVFGGQGIDQILYREIGGVELQITGAELQG